MFEDGNHFYRFLEHNPQVLSKCLNFTGATNDLEPRSCKEVGDDLRKLILAIYDAYVTEDGKHVDYEAIAKSEEFKRCVTYECFLWLRHLYVPEVFMCYSYDHTAFSVVCSFSQHGFPTDT